MVHGEGQLMVHELRLMVHGEWFFLRKATKVERKVNGYFWFMVHGDYLEAYIYGVKDELRMKGRLA